MGVPGFSTWFSKKACPQAFADHHGTRFDHVLIDLASILHTVLRRVKVSHQLHIQLYAELDRVLLRCQPRKSVLLAMDGPAPLAKLLTQRSRRTAASKRESRGKSRAFSSLGLTPGTPTMEILEDSLAYYVSQRLQNTWSHLHFELSGAKVAGEGEIKIFGRMQQPISPAHPEDLYAVVGGDSDLFLMALLRPAADNLWVISDSRQAHNVRSHGFSVKALDLAWGNLPQVNDSGPQKTAERLRTLKADMAAVAIIANGNDYLPGLVNMSLESSTAGKGLWDVYLALRNSPAWKDRHLVHLDDHGVHFECDMLIALLEKHQKHNSFPEDPRRDGWTLRKPPPEPANYLKGLEWVLNMYYEGECSDFRYVYDAQTPSPKELTTFLKSGGYRGGRDSVPASGTGPQAKTGPLNPATFAMALLPPVAGKKHAPLALRPLMESDSPIADIYAVCTQCEGIAETSASVNLQLAQAVKQLSAIDLDPAASSSAARDEATSHLQSLKAKTREVDAMRLQHVLDAHPYEPFPIDRIERAVAAVPAEDYPKAERQLLQFGDSYAYWKKGKLEVCCCPKCGTGRTCCFSYIPPCAPTKSLRPVGTEKLRRAPILDGSMTSRRLAEGLDSESSAASNSCRCPSCWARSREMEPGQPPVERRSIGRSRRRPAIRRPITAVVSAQGRASALGWMHKHARSSSKLLSHHGMLGHSGLHSLASRRPCFTCHAMSPEVSSRTYLTHAQSQGCRTEAVRLRPALSAWSHSRPEIEEMHLASMACPSLRRGVSSLRTLSPTHSLRPASYSQISSRAPQLAKLAACQQGMRLGGCTQMFTVVRQLCRL